jgi:hypothetical protein
MGRVMPIRTETMQYLVEHILKDAGPQTYATLRRFFSMHTKAELDYAIDVLRAKGTMTPFRKGEKFRLTGTPEDAPSLSI